VEVSRDERYIIAAGIYAPQIKIFDTAELSLKCLRGIDSEVVKFKILSDDYSKIVMAHTDRSIDFHAQYGAHYKTRIPHYPRDL
jgi:ribosome biogenesis protein ENP2